MFESDQTKGVKVPQWTNDIKGRIINLPDFDKNELTNPLYADLCDIRRSIRNYKDKPITQKQLAFYLWSTQGVIMTRSEISTIRPVPSGGARHPFETYFIAKNIEGLETGIYRYLPLENIGKKNVAIEYIQAFDNHDSKISRMLAGQEWAATAPVVFIYTCVPYRAEWRYSTAAHRVMLIDLGHLGQNAMLSVAALGLGSCCMAAFDQEYCDKILNIDSINEYTVYAISVGCI